MPPLTTVVPAGHVDVALAVQPAPDVVTVWQLLQAPFAQPKVHVESMCG